MLRQMLKPSTGAVKYMRNQSSATGSSINRLKGKVAIVTASTEGIGFAIAERLATEGAAVVISSRKAEKVASAVESLRKKNLKVEGIVCHVGNAEHRKKLFDTAVSKFGGLDILVSNAAVNPAVGPAIEADEGIWDKIFELNVRAAWLLAKEAYPLLRKRKGGSILFVSSIAGYQPMPLLGVYSISKTALLGLTKTLAADLANENIRVNCVAPGVIQTNFAQPLTATEESRDMVNAATLLGRLGRPEEIAGVAAFLVSDDASYVTAETIVAAGGMSSHL